MFKTSAVFNGQQRPVSFFDDDTIDIVRQQIAKSVDIHHNRLFILVGVKLSTNYYLQDPRNWETLFNRLSMNGMPIEREPFHEYCSTLRVPPVNIAYKKIDKEEWMSKPAFLQGLYDPGGEFAEYRILGVETLKSYCLPLEFDMATAGRIPSAQYPIPEEGRLFLSFYDTKDVQGFIVREFEEGAGGPYFPFLRSSTPIRLTEDQIKTLDNNSKHLEDLLALDPPSPTNLHILRASWRVDLVDTDFGDAVRTKFEQIFYGLTVSEDAPCITFFTDRKDVSRHKFFKTSSKSRTPYLDIAVWSAWWAKSKPSRDRPTLVLYRGKDREVFDRISITHRDIIFAAYRDSTNNKSLNELRDELLKWFETLDAIVPFVKTSDIAGCRVELQDVNFEASYKNSLDEFNTLRLGCLTGIFEENRIDKVKFRFLRSDNTTDEINPRFLKVVSLIRENPFIRGSEVEEELKISADEAKRLLADVNQRIQEQPNLLSRQFRGFPELLISPKSVRVNSVDSIERYLKYANILRYILSDPKSKDVDRVCPKRLEKAEAVVSTLQTDFVDTEFSDLFGYLEGAEVVEEPKQIEKPRTTEKKDSLHSYFNSRLEEFDPQTFHLTSKYPKKCEKSLQPVILSDSEVQDIVDDVTKGSEFDPQTYPENQTMKWSEPDGLVMCPEYWCMYDKIPLKDSQLEVVDGEKVCPVCHGKIRGPKNVKSDVREFPVVPRAKGHIYPGLKNDKSPINKRNLPCCYKNPQSVKLEKSENVGKYYIMGETKTELNPLRIAYLSASLISSLFLNETYALALKSANHIQTGMSGFFRVGIGRPSEGLPILLGLNTTVQSPRTAISCILRCSFVATWAGQSDAHIADIESKLDMKPFSKCETSRKHMARTISSIDEAFQNGTLAPVHELEYTAIVLKLDLFRINLDTNAVSCTFYTPQVKVGTRGAIILQRGNDIDCLSFVVREQKKFTYRSNIFEEPFKERTHDELTSRRTEACNTKIPTFSDAVYFMSTISEDDYSIVLDPFGRGQALYMPGELLLPFQNTPIPPTNKQLISGYHDMSDLPSYADMITILKRAQKDAPGYEWVEDLHDGKGNRVEILTRSGLRVAIKPERGEGENSQVIQTIIKEGETQLALGEENKEHAERYKSISYSAEIYEFLIFQLSKDLDEYPRLKRALLENTPRREDLEPALERWFSETTKFVSIDQPIEFLSKIRKPCGQFTKKDVCESGHMCAWNGKQCRIQVRDIVSKQKLFNKLLGTLLDNSKIRAIILDGRVTPFFSTILYLELPNEIIMTDYEVKTFTQ